MLDVGRICVKVMGREAGGKCVIVDIIDDKFVVITGPRSLTGVKRRRVNIRHIEPTEYRINLKKGASDEEVLKALEEANLVEYMRQRTRPNLQLVPTRT